jgi:bacterioferritin
MAAAATDQTVLAYLGRALSLELSAVQMYSTQARLVATWGLDAAARRLRDEAHEEMQHVERIIGRMLALGAAPNASLLRPVRLGSDLLSLLQVGFAFEKEVVRLYRGAVEHGARTGSHDDRVFFQTLLEEEEAHASELVQWMRQVDKDAGQMRQRGCG